ncbi:MAG TPA: DUF4412 domain-containing protein [Balneolaceae bacterium]|nr:DUF4412 domain-containing protein [Balneolaceae bacterium]
MKNVLYCLSALLLVVSFSQSAYAQFEGKISFNSYDYSADGSPQKQDEFTMYVTPDRILLQGNKDYKVMGSIRTEGILVRLDFKDFVFLTGDSKVLKISKSDITSMMNMFGDDNDSSSNGADDVDYDKTGETKTINGYKCQKFIFHDKDHENKKTVVWMTKDIDINWGMLAEPWGNNADEMISGGLPTDIIFKKKYFPLKAESYENDKLVSMLEASQVQKSSIAKAMVQVPSGVKVLSFQDYLFQKMSNQQ